MCLQLADQSVHCPAGIAEDIPVRVRDFFVHVDFVVLDMDVNTRMPLILGGPFLSTANANIDVGAGEIRLNINSEEERFTFRPKDKLSIEKILTLCKNMRWPQPNPR
jgi:hypothetical protein